MFENLDILGVIRAVIVMFVSIGFCIFIHELGHFLAGKWRGLHIDAFSLGFKKIWGKKINGVEYRIGCLPFGGYVELPQVDTTGIPHDAAGNELPPAKPLDRMITAFAGPFFNILFGLVLGCVIWIFGIAQPSEKVREFEVIEIEPSGPEYAAGLRVGDKIVGIGDQPFFKSWMDFCMDSVLTVDPIKLNVDRKGEKLDIVYRPKANESSKNVPEQLRREKVGYPFFNVRIPLIVHLDGEDSVAARAGFKEGDVIVKLNGEYLKSALYLFGELEFNGGKPMDFVVNRNGKMVEIKNVQPELEPIDPRWENIFNRYMTGISYSPDNFVLYDVYPASPADKSGLRGGDQLVKLNDESIPNANFIQKTIQDAAGQPVKITVLRDGREMEFIVTPQMRKNYDLGLKTELKEYPSPFRQFANTAVMSYKSLRALLVNLGSTLKVTDKTSTVGIRNMSGPIGMGTVIFKMSYSGNMMQVISFTVIITFALAIFNLFPLPVLDGGHITLGLIEIILRRPLPTGLVKVLNNVFIVLLISLMVAVSYFDFTRLLPAGEKIGRNTPTAAEKSEPESNGATPGGVILIEEENPAAENSAVTKSNPLPKVEASESAAAK